MTSSRTQVWAAALFGFSVLLFCWGLGRIPFYTKGEPREAVQVWDEVNRGEWILPLRNGHELPSKPPLFHWLGGVVALATGEVDEFSVRLPSAVLATFSVLLVFWLGLKKWGTSAGVFAALMLATNFEWMRAATTARVDMTVTAFMVGAFVALDRVVSAPSPTPRALFSFYLCMGLAALGKGPVGILLPAMVAVGYLALRRDLARLRQMRLFSGGAFALALALWWYVAAVLHGGMAFFQKQILVENFGRFFAAGASGAGHVHPFYYLIGGFFAGFLPWSLFVIPLGLHLYNHRRRLEALGYLYPLVWFVTVFVFYSLSQSKRTVYLLPLYPAASLLLGAWWSGIAENAVGMPPAVVRTLRVLGGVMIALLVVVSATLLATGLGYQPLLSLAPLLHPKDQVNLPLVEDLVRSHFSILLLWLTVLLPVLGLFAFGVHRGRWALVFAALVGFVASSIVVVNDVFHPELARQRTFKPFLESVRGIVGDEDDLYFYRCFDYGAVFYARRRIPPLQEGFGDPPSEGHRSYLLLWESQWGKLAAEEKERLEFLLGSGGTGPKGRDRLVFALVKSPAAPGATVLAEPPDDSDGED